VRAAPSGPLRISSGVAASIAIYRPIPVYPALAREARVEGTVVLEATISKTGSIENVRVVSGQAMLRQAALDAVSQWRYRPYLLNGEPVAVETTVNVVFNLQR
jgi:protein TonB